MSESRNASRVLVGRPEGKRFLEGLRLRRKNNIKMNIREIEYDGRDWINLAQDRDRCIITKEHSKITRVDGRWDGGRLLAFAPRETDRESEAAYNIATSYFTLAYCRYSAGENLNSEKTMMILAVDYCKHDIRQTLFPSLIILCTVRKLTPQASAVVSCALATL
ncbi:hypothetical protein ANN_27082 [Periplaneta americana]|uniref:Uncharacterized protein n=1 Tax=Periplaneta americana TaxID=6978 RepID=A0ABQ8RXL3_PERAM|nr:hypothetical protein ANN_27082 [Periplaneta americana]